MSFSSKVNDLNNYNHHSPGTRIISIMTITSLYRNYRLVLYLITQPKIFMTIALGIPSSPTTSTH